MASEEPKKEAREHSSSELLASAKVVAEAARSGFGKEGEQLEKGKVADAAGDLLDAAGQYGKLDDQKGIGQYVDKAADYLHQYEAKETNTTAETKGEESGGGGGLGGLANLAGGFFKK
ncbi:nodulin-related protein 1 [Cajanus cajan]|uniref:nodulin-related protein 1 n=1 Tax=Cajanus cajan TaxID=3821 RepID=UPI00098DC40B|nr:nodulin-related protein 1 [Cajanus cajan]